MRHIDATTHDVRKGNILSFDEDDGLCENCISEAQTDIKCSAFKSEHWFITH
jgi:hypothetical protein